MIEILRVVFRWVRRVLDRVVDPLRANTDNVGFRLSIPETSTTTIDGDIGWGSRPPALLRCPRCGSDVYQRHPFDDIDCPRCVAEHPYEEFAALELRYFLCPVCGDEMEHGWRHPEVIDVPEWATCHSCRYHWEFRHDYEFDDGG
jgi:transcription initiation factor IIE alpha subunit